MIPNVNTSGELKAIWPRLSPDERRLFNVVARAYLAALMPDFRYRQTTATLDVGGHAFRGIGRQPLELGWRAAFPDWRPAEEAGEDGQSLPPLRDGEPASLSDAAVKDKVTRPPPRYGEGTLVEAMQNAWRFVEDEALRAGLREAKGIGTPATRAEIIRGLKAQEFLAADGKHVVPTARGLALFEVLQRADPALVDPGVTAQLECLLDEVLVGRQGMVSAVDAVCAQASRIIARLTERAGEGADPLLAAAVGGTGRTRGPARARSATAGRSAQVRGRKGDRKGSAAVAEDAPIGRETPPGRHAGETAGSAPPAERTTPSAGETALRIPFGNKEAALRLGARYRADGWYAPPGAGLDAFRARGWL